MSPDTCNLLTAIGATVLGIAILRMLSQSAARHAAYFRERQQRTHHHNRPA